MRRRSTRPRSPVGAGLCLALLTIASGAVRPAGAEVAVALPLPEGSVLVECESLPDSNWHRYADATCSGGAKALSNDPKWAAQGSVDLAGERYVVWVRSADNGAYPGHYHYDLAIDGRPRRMADVEPLGHGWVWERWGEVGPGRHTVRLTHADTFPASADCILFTPDAAYRPSGRPQVGVSIEVPSPLPRRGGRCTLTLTPWESLPEQRLWLALRRGKLPVWHAEAPLPAPAPSWAPGQPVSVPVTFPDAPMRFLAPGEYALTAELSGCEWAGREEGDAKVASVTLGPRERARPCVARIRRRSGDPTLFVNGRPLFPFAFLGVGTTHYHEFAEAGGHLYSVGASLGFSKGPELDPVEADGPFQAVLAEDPRALIFPRAGVTPPQWWLDAHPEERVVFDDGSLGPQSMASERWLEEVGRELAAYVRYVRASPYADRVIGYHLATGESAEWQAWGLWSERRGDFSAPMRRAFGAWLRARYRTQEALRAAWGDRGATFEGVRIPGRQAREASGPALLDPKTEQAVIDFYAFYPTVTARAITYLARVVKDASGGEALAGFFYGYAPQYGPIAVESQHLALEPVLKCPDVDFLCSPAMYSDRQPGGTSNFMSLTDSVRLRGKLWLNEADIRTHLQQDPVGRCATPAETLGVLKREYGAVRAQGAGLWWFDMTAGWFSDPEIERLFAGMQRDGTDALRDRAAPAFAPEIGVFFDEKSAFRQRPAAGDLYHFGITMQVASLRRLGAPTALHLLSDLARVPDYKVYLFLNATDLTPAERRRIDGLKRDGRTLIFAHAPGFGRLDRRGLVQEDLAGMRELTGLDVQALPGAGPLHARLTDDPVCADPVLLEAYGGRSSPSRTWLGGFGPKGDYAPRFVAAEEGARVLARYPDGQAAMVLERFPGWTSVYSAVPGIPPGVLHHLAREAGVHLFTGAGDALYAGRGIVALHAREAGEKTIDLPGRFDVREILGAGRSWPAARRISAHLDANETLVLSVSRTHIDR